MRSKTAKRLKLCLISVNYKTSDTLNHSSFERMSFVMVIEKFWSGMKIITNSREAGKSGQVVRWLGSSVPIFSLTRSYNIAIL